MCENTSGAHAGLACSHLLVRARACACVRVREREWVNKGPLQNASGHHSYIKDIMFSPLTNRAQVVRPRLRLNSGSAPWQCAVEGAMTSQRCVPVHRSWSTTKTTHYFWPNLKCRSTVHFGVPECFAFHFIYFFFFWKDKTTLTKHRHLLATRCQGSFLR